MILQSGMTGFIREEFIFFSSSGLPIEPMSTICRKTQLQNSIN